MVDVWGSRFHPEMVSGIDWVNFLNKSESKKDSITLRCSYLQTDCRNLCKI